MYLTILISCFSFLTLSACQKTPAPGNSAEQGVLQPKTSPDFKNAVSITTSFEGASQKLTVQIRLASGFHAYAPGEKTGKPVSLRVEEKNGWLLASPIDLPEGKKKTFRSLGESQVLEGSFTIQAYLAGGKGPIAAEISLQICTAELCDRPRAYPLSIDIPNEKYK